jgi:hypothetical protein
VFRKPISPPADWSPDQFEEAVRLRAWALAERQAELERWTRANGEGDGRLLRRDGRTTSRVAMAQRARREAEALRVEIDRLVAVASERFGGEFAGQLRDVAGRP